jgi:glycosyltransferase involved in cell wall biosynthesis
MRLLFVVQRYGHQVAGGSERCCREYASRMAGRGHDVEVLTTCALSYVDWANAYPPGTEVVDGVPVHRLAVTTARDNRLFASLQLRMGGRSPAPIYLQRQWMRAQGPLAEGIGPWLQERAREYDVIIFFTYLYFTTWAGLPVASSLTPTILHPTAHDERPLYLFLFDLMFRLPSGFGYLTPEEGELVRRRFRIERPSAVLGVGVDLDGEADEGGFREAYGLGDRPYLVYVGRVDPHKGSEELYHYFVTYKERNPGELALVVVGEPVAPLPPHPDVVFTGFVDEGLKRSAIAGSRALVQPSYFESFAMSLTEAWAHRKPALVQGHCEVLVGQARRSGGGIPYNGFPEFEAAVDLLRDDVALGARLGDAGRRHVEKRYAWDGLLERYERLLELVSRR